MTKYLAAALLTTALFTCTASAQTASSKNTESAVSAHKEGEWRASKLVGVDVYNEANEKIGDINEIILDKSGKAAERHPGRRRLPGYGRALRRRRL